MNRTPTLAAAFAAFSLAACSGSGPESPAADHDRAPATAPANDHGTATVFGDQLNALDKAKSVNRMVEEQAERQRRAIEQQGQ